ERAGLGWFAVAPGTPGGAIAARSIVYWLRDRRYLVNAAVIPVAAAIALVPPPVAGVPLSLVILLPVPVVGLFFGWLPPNDLAARSIVYWLRDRRYLVNAAVIPVAAAIALVPPLVAGVPLSLVILLPVPIVALFFGWLPHNDIAYDSTAVWMHIASGVRGVSD